MNSRTQSSSVLTSTSNSTSTTLKSTSVTSVQQTTPSIKVTLEVPLMKAESLYPTPSMKDNLPFDVEFDLRLVGCELIQTSGRLLKLPQTAMATGQVLFHRFYYSKSFVKNPMEYYAMAAVFLSSKIEECPRRIRDVLNVFHHIKLVRSGKLIKPMPIDENYHNAKNQVIKAERRLLKELGFCVHVKHPHKIILIYLQAMECSGVENLSQKAWNYMNDGLRTDIFLRYSPEIIACACIYLSARELEISLPENPPWYYIFGADEESIKAICVRILHLYTHKTRQQEELEKIINDCRDKLEQDKKRAKEATSTTGILEQPVETQNKPDLKSESVATSEEIKKTSEQIKQITAGITAKTLVNSITTKKFSNTPPNLNEQLIPPIHPNHYYTNSHHMTRHSSFNYNYYHGPHPGHYMNPNDYYGAYNEHGYYNENYYEVSNMKRNKSASYLIQSTHPKDYDDYAYKRYPADKERIKSYRDEYQRHRSASRSRSRSRSKSKKLKSSKHRTRSRSRSVSSVDMENVERGSKSPVSSKHKKKKSHHTRHKDDDKKRDRSREKDKGKDRERERERSRDKEHKSQHHKSSSSSKHSKDRSGNNDPRYVPIYS